MVNKTGHGSKPGIGSKAIFKNSLGPMCIIRGLIASFIITIIVFAVFSLLLAYTDFPEKHIVTAVVAATIASALTAGVVSTRGVRSRGWVNGSIVGLIYILVLYLLSSIVYMDFTVDGNFPVMVLICLLSGIIGGIAGVNMKDKKH